MALAARFGLNLEECDPEVFAALEDLLSKRDRQQRRDSLHEQLKGMLR